MSTNSIRIVLIITGEDDDAQWAGVTRRWRARGVTSLSLSIDAVPEIVGESLLWGW